jgi:hypothetical protein
MCWDARGRRDTAEKKIEKAGTFCYRPFLHVLKANNQRIEAV